MKVDHLKPLIIPVLRKHKVTRAGFFGSIAKGNATEQSDIDLLVELTYPASLLDFAGLKLELETLLGKKVDLVEYRAIKPLIKDSILGNEIRIYG
jgi:predicted nucleotidyltransferase